MRALIYAWIACAAVASAGVALAAPARRAGDSYKQAVKLVDSGDYEQALAVIEAGLALAPKDIKLLGLKGIVLLTMHDYSGALAAEEVYLDAGVTGANRREAERIVKSLSAVRTTFLEITLANGPATLYLGSKAQGVFCTAAPSCQKPMLPDDYKVIAERAGFELWSGRVTVAASTTTKLAITLVEKPSQLTLRVTPPGAQVTVDGVAYDAPVKVAAGIHQIAASLAGHSMARLEIAAHEGVPVVRDIPLTPLVPVRIAPATAALLVDGKPVTVEDGGIPIGPGDHELVASEHGFVKATVKIPAMRAADYQIAVALEPIPSPTVSGPARGRFTARRKIALAVGGLGVAAVAGGAVLGVQSKHRKDDAFALCPSPSSPCAHAPEADRAYDSGRSRALAADIAFGVAGGAAIAAAVLWLTGAPEAQVAVSPRLGPVAGLDLAVRF